MLSTPGVRAFLVSGFAARQPFAMLTVSMVLLVDHVTGSYGTAGAAAAVTGASMALFAPRGGRLADRYGQRKVLLPGITLHAVSVAAVALLALSDAPAWALLIAAVPTGATVPQIGPMVRSRWIVALGGGGSPLGATAAAFESVTDELTFVIGPVLATALCTSVHPAAGLIAEGTLTVVGGSLFAMQQRCAPPLSSPSTATDAGRAPRSALSNRGMPALVVAFLGIGTVFGGMQVSVAAFVQETGHPGLNGVLYGTFAAGNMLSGIVCGTLKWRSAPRSRLLAALCGLTAACALLWLARTVPALGLFAFVVGMFIAPTIVTGYSLVDTLVPQERRTESFTWMTGAVALGQAAAVTSAGVLTDAAGSRCGFLVPMAGTAAALSAVVALRKGLRPQTPDEVTKGVISHRQPVPVD
nr:MFS transporter [Actinacidiphila yeochonensis]